jgi:tellurite resistance protein TehA-like permease
MWRRVVLGSPLNSSAVAHERMRKLVATHLRLSYNVRRWSTVFPVGMYAACSFVVGAVTGTRAITDFADVWVWVGVAVWSVVFVAMIRRGRALALADSRSSSSRSR